MCVCATDEERRCVYGHVPTTCVRRTLSSAARPRAAAAASVARRGFSLARTTRPDNDVACVAVLGAASGATTKLSTASAQARGLARRCHVSTFARVVRALSLMIACLVCAQHRRRVRTSVLARAVSVQRQIPARRRLVAFQARVRRMVVTAASLFDRSAALRAILTLRSTSATAPTPSSCPVCACWCAVLRAALLCRLTVLLVLCARRSVGKKRSDVSVEARARGRWCQRTRRRRLQFGARHFDARSRLDGEVWSLSQLVRADRSGERRRRLGPAQSALSC